MGDNIIHINPPQRTDGEKLCAEAIHCWCVEHKIDSNNVKILLELIFPASYALYGILSGYGERPKPKQTLVNLEGERETVFVNFPSSMTYIQVRSIVAAVGDLYDLIESATRLEPGILTQKIVRLRDEILRFRDVRTFFVHFGELLNKRKQKGVSGPLDLAEIGVILKPTARDCFYVGFNGNDVYFCLDGKPCSVTLSLDAFRPYFEVLKDIYNTITAHSLHATQYPPFESFLTNQYVPVQNQKTHRATKGGESKA